MAKRKRHYVYGLFFEDEDDNVCFYIGKGCGNRKDKHFYPSASQCNPHKSNKIAKLRSKGMEPFSKVLKDGLSEDEAFALEQALLNRDDVFNALTNISRNATGFPSGENHPMKRSEYAKKVSASLKGKTLSKTHKDAISESLKGRIISDEHRRKISDSLKGNTLSKEAKRKISEANSGRKHTKEARRKISEGLKGRPVSKETRLKLSEKISGPDHHNAKLCVKDVREIRWLLSNTKLTQKKIAQHYSVTAAAIRSIKSGRTWSSYEGANKPTWF